MSTSPDAVTLPPGLAPLEEGDPERVGPYRVVGRIGSGGMGAVFGALDGQGACVAVKTVHTAAAEKPAFREAFAREVEMLGRADGISTARLHAADPAAPVPWLAFDYVPGRDLRAHVRAFGPLEGDMLRTFALGAAEGLAALHGAGIAHRDIKPGNVILSPDGPKIVDFGIAVDIGTERSADASATYGTPGWSAPERYSGAAADPAADVFAWGGLVTLAATGRQPFGTGDAGELARRVREGEHDVEGVPEDLVALVEEALSVDPGRRPTSEALVGALLPEPVDPPGEVRGERRPVTAADTLRRMLGDYWRGVDDAGHDPARWAAALGTASAVGLGAGAVGSGAATAGGGVAGTGTAGAAAAGSGSTGLASGGALSAVATSKMGLAGAGLLTVAGLAAVGAVSYDQLRVTPGERIAAAADVLEQGQGFTASVERSFTEEHAEEVSGRTGTPVDQVVEDSRVEEEYLYSAGTDSFLVRGEGMGAGTTAVANHEGELYVYAEREEASVPEEAVEVRELEPGFGADSVAATLVSAPLRALAEEDAEAEEGQDRVYTGPAVLGFLDGGDLVEEQVVARVELDEEERPVWAEYTADRRQVRVEFEEVDSGVRLEDPQMWAAGEEGPGWKAVHAPICGSVVMGEPYESEWDVRATGWDMDCDGAMDVADVLENPAENSDRTVHLWGYSSGGFDWVIDESVVCSDSRDLPAALDNPELPGIMYEPCSPVTELTQPDPEGSPAEYEAEVDDIAVIDFHERG
ncbi:serine/threonine protein kinase [Nocardiopsis sp. HNM0947]|uniref:Serine/threonine protein kinase n=1 Tax=Nocardiopsis coralli TaxID=2772213 RepID=A0ABR9P9G9_9ACTN|nr:serine/threonine-protein kinase [Nocardiopsis coralli]MBE3000486.1 serine/threonine protein kinase [Nocardiopsis coralli]